MTMLSNGEFDAWQQSECVRLGITLEEHWQTLNAAGQSAAKGGAGYDLLVDALETKTPSTSILTILAGFGPKGDEGDDEGPFDTGEGDDAGGPYGT